MAKHGGKRQNAGRKPKSDELKKIQLMDSVLAPVEIWQALSDKVKEGDTQAIKAWIDHRFGKAKESKEVEHSGTLETKRLIDDVE